MISTTEGPRLYKPRDWQNAVYNNVIRRIEALFIYFIVTRVKNIVSHTEACRGLSYIHYVKSRFCTAIYCVRAGTTNEQNQIMSD